MVAAKECAIPMYGYENLILSFGNGKFNWKILVADVILPIIDVDFLSYFHLLVDVVHRPLVNADSYLLTPLQPTPSNFALYISAPTYAYAHLLTSYLEVFRPELQQTHMAPAKHGIYHLIKTTGTPVFAKFRRLVPDRLAAAKMTFAEMEKMGLCQKASSPWTSPLYIVLKKRRLPPPVWGLQVPEHANRTGSLPSPKIADVTSYLQKAKVFSTLDLLKGCY
ncbi:uncharacterized protein [Palaemon carinicauda]|uniref:uncharacterized protein n=1 Tax=Palaemon carinicauda TaxID=392227 RepID=UPI0035B634F3